MYTRWTWYDNHKSDPQFTSKRSILRAFHSRFITIKFICEYQASVNHKILGFGFVTDKVISIIRVAFCAK